MRWFLVLDEYAWSLLHLAGAKMSVTVSPQNSMQECLPCVNPASGDMISASVLLWDTNCFVFFCTSIKLETNV